MTMGEAISTCMSKYVDFSGRASRSEYWFWALFMGLIYIGAGIVDSALGNRSYLTGLAQLFFLLPAASVSVRRFHDTGKSGLWYLLTPAASIGMLVGLTVGFLRFIQGDPDFIGRGFLWLCVSSAALQAAVVAAATSKGESEGWHWLGAIPLFGMFVPFVFTIEPGEEGVNAYD